MAVLPTYVGQGSISSGTDTLRTLRSDDSLGTSLRRFGASIGEAGLQSARADIVVAAANDAEQKRIDGLGDALTRETMETEWKAKQTEIEQSIDPTGKGHTAAIATAWKEHEASYANRWSERRYAENQVLNARFGGKVVERAIDVEANTRFQGEKVVAEKVVKDLSASVFENPALFDTAISELNTRADIHGFTGRVRQAYLDTGRRSIEAARLTAAVRDDPFAVISFGENAFKNVPTDATQKVAAEVSVGAQASGMDPKLLLGIAKIESNFDPKAKPVGKDGKLLSSAAGVFQILQKNSAYGTVDPNDTTGQARAVGLFLSKQKERLEDAGIEASPGRLYMFHNLGEPLAMALLRAGPDEKMADVVNRTYASRPELAAKVLANNPSLYKGNTSVRDVVQNYEVKMSGAMKSVDAHFTERHTTDDVAKGRMSELLGVTIEKIGANELMTAMNDARTALAKEGKLQAKLLDGQSAHSGERRIDPYDTTEKKALNEYAATTGIADAMLQGDEQGFAAARASIANANVIAQPYLHAARELVMNGDPANPAKAKAYAFLASVARDNTVAWDASQVPDAVKDRIKDFRAMTEGDDAIVSPAEAIKRITFEHSPAGDSAKQAARELFKARRGHEEKQLTLGEVEAAVSKGLWRNGDFFSTDSATNDIRKQVMFDNYKQSYSAYRMEGKDIETSKKRALQDIADNYKQTHLFRGMGRAEITRYPAEARYPAIDADDPYGWIEKQGRNLVLNDIRAKGLLSQREGGEGAFNTSNVEIRLVPTAQTVRDFSVPMKLPAYDLMWRNPKTGLFELAQKDWRPNHVDAQAEFDERFTETVKSRRSIAPTAASLASPVP
jgi:hypothetical protein